MERGRFLGAPELRESLLGKVQFEGDLDRGVRLGELEN